MALELLDDLHFRQRCRKRLGRRVFYAHISQMSQKRLSVDQIMAKLRRAEVLFGKDTKVPEICKQLEIAEQTYLRWLLRYGGMQPKNLCHGFGFRLSKIYDLIP